MRPPLCFIMLGLAFCAILAAGDVLPAEVEKAIAERKESIAKADKTYLAKLEELRKRFSDSGNTKDAGSVSRLIQQAGGIASVAADPESQAILAKLVGTWKRDYDSSVFLFKDTTSGSWAGKEDFTMIRCREEEGRPDFQEVGRRADLHLE